MPKLLWARTAARKVLGERFADWYRRRRATRQYLEALSYELLERETRLDHLEGRIAARRDGFYQRIVTDVLERTEIILQELDRRIEGLTARTGQRLSGLEDEVAALREELDGLRRSIEPGAGRRDGRETGAAPAPAAAETRSAVGE
jgi:hypothetical protein